LVAVGGTWLVVRDGRDSVGTTVDFSSESGSVAGSAGAQGRDATAVAGEGQRGRVDTAGPDAHREPAKSGAALKQLMQAPEKTMLALPADKYASGLKASVVFEPYGMGPPSFGRSIAVNLISFDPGDSGLPDLKGRNVVLVLDGVTVDSGGRYSGRVTTRVFGDQTALMLTDVEAK
jgi:hypothetical protein